MNEMPNCPKVVACQCFADLKGACACGRTEKALRAWSYWTVGKKLRAMTAEQREWCLNEIGSVEGYKRADYQLVTDGVLASTVLSAWRHVCRNEGLML